MPKEANWTVEGRRIAGVVSGPVNGPPVLALHGWLDNAASFDVLRDFLPQFRLVAIDMPGHGMSDHRSADASYQLWDDLPQLAGLIEQLGWERCTLLGHSRGAGIATLLAAARPELAAALITLDGVAPVPVEDVTAVRQLRSFLKDRVRLTGKPVRVFESVEDFVSRRARSGEPENIARQLARRALAQTEAGFEWRGDPRLTGASALKLNEAQIETFLRTLEMPVLNIWATPSERMKYLSDMAKEKSRNHIRDQTSVEVSGHHHWHMEEEPAQEIAAIIRDFHLKRVKTANPSTSSND